jgi:hypothetical protein
MLLMASSMIGGFVEVFRAIDLQARLVALLQPENVLAWIA